VFDSSGVESAISSRIVRPLPLLTTYDPIVYGLQVVSAEYAFESHDNWGWSPAFPVMLNILVSQI